MNLMWLFHAPRSLQGLSENSVGTLRELCGNSLGPPRELSGNPKGQKPMVCARLSRFLARRMSAFRDGTVIAKQWKWRAKVWESIEKRLSQNVEFNGKVTPKVTILDQFVQLCGDVWVIFHPVGGDFAWKSMDSGWLFMTLRWLFDAPWTPREHSAGTPRKLPKPKIHD